MTLDVYASLPHYKRHMLPIVVELKQRGVDVRCWSRWGDGWPVLTVPDRLNAHTVMVAGWQDATDTFPHARCVYVEHGAGQSYIGVDGFGYAGAPKLDHVVLFVAPGEHVARRWRDRYPNAAVATVGSPALDAHFNGEHRRARDAVVFSAHWRCSVTSETMPALPHHLSAVPALASLSLPLIGSVHPRAVGETRALYGHVGVAPSDDPEGVLARARVVVGDNTSLLYEAAALDVPVVVLNAPWYRRDVHHGLRFWSHVPGVQVNEPNELAGAIAAALDGAGTEDRRYAAAYVYAHRDGKSAARAADAIEGVL